MGIIFRKGLKFGPFRLNLSKSGIGWSFGVKGVRYTKTAKGNSYGTINIPRTGISYRSNFSQAITPEITPFELAQIAINNIEKTQEKIKIELKDEFGNFWSVSMDELSDSFQVTEAHAKYLLVVLIKALKEYKLPEQFLVKDAKTLGGVEIDRIYFEQLCNQQILNREGWYYSLNLDFVNSRINSLINSKKTKEDKNFDSYLRMILIEEKKWRAKQCKNIKKEWWEE